MINFRFHLVSLVAVFLALAAGIVIGSTVVDTAVVDGLRDRIDTVENRAEKTDDENRDLRSQVDDLTAEAEATSPYAVKGALQGVPVATVAVRGVDERRVDTLVQRVVEAGGIAPAVIWLEPSWNLQDPDERARLQSIVGRASSSADALRSDGLDLLARRLAGPRRAAGDTATTTPGTDVLQELVDAGFVTVDTLPGVDASQVDAWPGTGGRALIIGGQGQKLLVEGVAAEIARALQAAEIPTVAADVYSPDEQQGRASRLESLRASDDLSKRVSTVDNLDQPSGSVASVLALHDIVLDRIGHYGYGEGAQRPLPAWNTG